MKILVVGSSSPIMFQEELQKACDELTKEGYEIEIQTHVNSRQSLAAVVIGRQRPQYFVSPKVETKVELDGRTIAQKVGDFMTKQNRLKN